MNSKQEASEDNQEALQQIRRKFNVNVDRFESGVSFTHKILDGMSKNKAYMEVFDCTPDKARTSSSQFHRGKWIQELILFLTPDRESLYTGEVKRIISRNMKIINDPRSSPKEITDSTRALQPYIKVERQRLDIEVNNTVTSGESIVQNISSKIDLLVEQGKMVSPEGEIIDVETIE